MLKRIPCPPSKATFIFTGTPVRRTNPSSVSDDPVQVDPVQVDPVQVDPVQVDPVQVDKVTYTGVIEILNANNGHVIGYISKNLGNGGTQFVYDPSISNALIVSFQTDGTGDGTQLDISILVCSVAPSVLDTPHLPTFRARIQTGPFWVSSRVVTTSIHPCHLATTSESPRFDPFVPWIDVFLLFFIGSCISVVSPAV